MGPGFESQRDHKVKSKPSAASGWLFFAPAKSRGEQLIPPLRNNRFSERFDRYKKSTVEAVGLGSVPPWQQPFFNKPVAECFAYGNRSCNKVCTGPRQCKKPPRNRPFAGPGKNQPPNNKNFTDFVKRYLPKLANKLFCRFDSLTGVQGKARPYPGAGTGF
jgi:hypothetical protein